LNTKAGGVTVSSLLILCLISVSVSSKTTMKKTSMDLITGYLE
jgi:hypothetical protein